ncbi:hypothetical protein RHAB21_02501 [Pseudorhizobium halotolerans]|uniref:Uncharacterized protein n=1 Tax=Pseudorhizobium halotolerans TaxID=1233081 RepID=A0ABM8PLC2_9HYPH|nr:hypothetical protein [Pseudorhizobium halotolerans]CAD7036248.1 hypothetical protein RHAB21_02501 [Pseudorhizobium halotolerans]
MLSFLPNPITRALGGLAVAALVVGGAYTYGKAIGRQGAAVDALEKQVQAYKDRNDENAAVEALDPVALCIELGGVPDDCRAELRRLGEDQPEAVNGGLPRRQ